MTKVVIELELDNEKYDAYYGPGSEWWAKYGHDKKYNPQTDEYEKVPREYVPTEGQLLYESIMEVICEGFYEWYKEGWLKLTIDGKPMRECCQSIEGDKHLSYCDFVSGPEASS
jgi:hypothetical protein